VRIVLATIILCGAGAGAPLAGECADQTQSGLNQCADADLKRADQELNRAYDQILRRLDKDERSKQALTAAEKAWVGFRDAECKFRADPAQQGSIWGMEHLVCLSDLTKARTKDLIAYLHCEEGDLQCPVPQDRKSVV
jgi:uncharacterized protein YecT (DUF1311 family)